MLSVGCRDLRKGGREENIQAKNMCQRWAVLMPKMARGQIPPPNLGLYEIDSVIYPSGCHSSHGPWLVRWCWCVRYVVLEVPLCPTSKSLRLKAGPADVTRQDLVTSQILWLHGEKSLKIYLHSRSLERVTQHHSWRPSTSFLLFFIFLALPHHISFLSLSPLSKSPVLIFLLSYLDLFPLPLKKANNHF